METTDLARLAGAAVARADVPPRVARTGEILDLVRSGTADTTSALAAALGLARSTVAERVDLLLRHGLLLQQGGARQARGRPSARFRFDARSGLTLAAQLGVSGARVAVTDLAGDVLLSRTVDVDLHLGPRPVLEVVVLAFESLLEEQGETWSRVRGIGLGVPGSIELATAHGPAGTSHHPWDGFDVAAHVATRTGVPVQVDQDVNLLALGEHRAAWPRTRVFLCIKVGTAIGCGILVNGEILRGGAGLAGEIGHTPVPGSVVECACGNLGCLNAVASGAALVARLAGLGAPVSSSRDVASLALHGDVAVAQAVRQAGRDVGQVLAGAVNLLNPDAVVLWGYLADARDHLLAGIRESLSTHVVPAAHANLVVAKATLGHDAGVRGAAAMVVERTLSAEAVDAWVHREQLRRDGEEQGTVVVEQRS